MLQSADSKTAEAFFERPELDSAAVSDESPPAVGTVVFGLYSNLTGLRQALLVMTFLFIPAAAVAMFLPELTPEEGGTN